MHALEYVCICDTYTININMSRIRDVVDLQVPEKVYSIFVLGLHCIYIHRIYIAANSRHC